MTAKNKTDLGTEIDAQFPTNATGDITAARLRTVTHDIINSMATGTDAAPDTSETIDNSAARGKFRVGGTSQVEIAAGPTGTADASLHTAIRINP